MGSALAGRYTVVKKLTSSFNKEAWRGALGRKAFVYVTTHGSPDFYEMENGDPYQDEPESEHYSHKSVLMDTVGASFNSITYPPYNPSSVPPPLFVFVDSCNTFQSDFSWTLYPKLNLYDGSGIPRSKNIFTAGWKVSLLAKDSEVIARKITEYLFQGNPAERALQLAVQDLCALGITTQDGDPLDISMVGTHGDKFAKVAGIYTGDNEMTLDWHRSSS